MTAHIGSPHVWPRLKVDEWTLTRDTLHMWTQILGKIRMSQTPLVNHWWQVTLHVSPRGLTTGTIPYRGGSFDLELDVTAHHLRVRSSAGEERLVGLSSRPVADFYAGTMQALDELGIDVVDVRPNGVHLAIPIPQDEQHATYDPAAAQPFWQQLVPADRGLSEFRSHLVGKVSPGHFFRGALRARRRP
jgi:hypothetical protein